MHRPDSLFAGLLCSLAIAVQLHLTASEGSSDPATNLDSNRLLEQLKDGDFDAREAAVEGLAARGETARDALQEALAKADTYELRLALSELLKKLEKATLHVHVIDRKGQAIAEVEGATETVEEGVTASHKNAHPRPPAPPHQIKTDPKGVALIEPLSPGADYRIATTWKTYFPDPLTSLPNLYRLQKGDNHLFQVLLKGGSIEGRVLAKEDGKPIKNVSISLELDQGQSLQELLNARKMALAMGRGATNGGLPSGTTDEGGRFVLKDIPEGTYRVIASQEGFEPASSPSLRVRWSETLKAGPVLGLTRQPDFGVGALQLTILDAEEKPLKKKTVSIGAHRIPNEQEKEAYNAELAQRIRLMQWQGGNENQFERSFETDEKGRVKLEDLQPGVYRVSIYRPEMSAVVIEDVHVLANETTERTSPKPGRPASIEGLVKFSDPTPGVQVFLLDENDPVTLAILSEAHQNTYVLHRQRNIREHSVSVSQDGKYALRSVCPGTYTVCVMSVYGQAGLIHGVRAEEGKTATAPVLTLPKSNYSQRMTSTETISVEVTGFDGKTTISGTSLLLFDSGQLAYGNVNNNKTTLPIHPSYGHPQMLAIACPGYRAVRIELGGKSGKALTTHRIRLEEQTFGRALVSVRDLQGRALQGAFVAPRAMDLSQMNSGYPSYTRSRTTNKDGQAVLKGLATGERKFEVFQPGYFLEKPALVKIEQDKDTAVEITMQPGLRLTGTVAEPDPITPVRIWVHLIDTFHVTRVKETETDGSFVFSGLAPGKYRLEAQAPGLLPSDPCHLELTTDQPAKPVHLVPIEPCVWTMTLGPKGAGSRLCLMKPGAWDPDRYADESIVLEAKAKKPRKAAPNPSRVAAPNYEATADAEGNACFVGLKAGLYDLQVSPKIASPGIEQYAKTNLSITTAIFPGIKIETKNDPGKIHPLALSTDSKGLVSGSLKSSEKDTGKPQTYYQATLYLVGPKTLAHRYFPVFPPNPALTPGIEIIGTPPIPQLKAPEPGSFTFRNLPPGTYRLLMRLQGDLHYANYRSFRGRLQSIINYSHAETETPPLLLKTLEIGADQALDLGEIEVALPKPNQDKPMDSNPDLLKQIQEDLVGFDKPEP